MAAMATQTQLPDILTSFGAATATTLSSLPSADNIIPPQNGITLLDAKNEIFLSYLQGLALRNLNVVRSLKEGKSLEDVQELNDKITKKLVEQRVYLERGVRPLEGKIKYQVERVVKAAEDEERSKKLQANGKAKANGHVKKDTRADDESSSGSDSDEESDESNDEALARPNASSLNKSTRDTAVTDRRAKSKEDGVYRPPRISATTMPTTSSRPEDKPTRGPGRSRTLDEYISTELSAAPAAQPSIGSTIAADGRTNKDARQLAREQERRNYEETNLVRLPKESKKELGKQKGRDRQRDGGGFGGEEWRDLGASVDRIGDLTRRKGGKGGVLERSRKRGAEGSGDGQRGDGVGDAFEQKRRRVMKKRR